LHLFHLQFLRVLANQAWSADMHCSMLVLALMAALRMWRRGLVRALGGA
jgi:hypothetical protein